MMYVLGKRITMLKRGQLDVVQFLRDLPRTVHYSKSFIVDCLYSTVSAAIVFMWTVNVNVQTIIIMYTLSCRIRSNQSQQTAFVVNGLFSECEQILFCVVRVKNYVLCIQH